MKSIIEEKTATKSQLEESLAQTKAELSNIEHSLESLQRQEKEQANLLRDYSSQLSANKAKLENVISRKQKIETEISEHHIQLAENAEQATIARVALEEAIDLMANHSEKRESLTAEKERLQTRERETQEQVRLHQDSLHELELKRQTLTTQCDAMNENINRLKKQKEGLLARQEQVMASLSEDDSPTESIQAELETLLDQRVTIEDDLHKARNDLETQEHSMRGLEKERVEVENSSLTVRERLDKLRLSWQALEVRKDTINEQFATHEIDVKVVLDNLPEEANEKEWSEQVEKLTNKIERLGAINLAAIEEYDAELERQQYLTSQYEDLTEALTTLENAIRKIDKETRLKFKETFDKVNDSFQKLFPKLFGGGEAVLELTGDDLLEAGVTVMARPPGKRNSSIHLLSGGEKALTAVSLVFSIFQLNPAPFCMLDEVDAPLDDANVGRYCKMIQEMSEHVQFIFITHNKITMEIANQLAGVTMKEPGVSRLVSVDIDEAMEMALA